jgi:hypothetical protein
VRRIRLRCDAGFFDGRFIEYLERHRKAIDYVIKGKMKNMVQLMGLGSIKEWKGMGDHIQSH